MLSSVKASAVGRASGGLVVLTLLLSAQQSRMPCVVGNAQGKQEAPASDGRGFCVCGARQRKGLSDASRVSRAIHKRESSAGRGAGGVLDSGVTGWLSRARHRSGRPRINAT